jgi:hypothetical protein
MYHLHHLAHDLRKLRKRSNGLIRRPSALRGMDIPRTRFQTES